MPRSAALAAVADARLAWDAAEAIRSAPKDAWRQRRTDEIAAAKRRLLDGAVGMGLAAGVPARELAEAAGLPEDDIAAVAHRLRS